MRLSPLPLMQGTVDLLVLGTLASGAMHGYGIATLVHERTAGDLTIEDAALYQALSTLVAGFALVALVLSAVGIYGVMAYYVQQHAKDISIRLALGGRTVDVLRLVVGQGMTVVMGGVVVGLLTAFASTRLMSSLLFGVNAADASTFLAVSLFLIAVALVACLVPARRAMGLEPVAMLRNE